MKDFILAFWYWLKPILITLLTCCINWIWKYFSDRKKFKQHLEECKLTQKAPMSFKVFKDKNKPWWLRHGQ